MGDCIRGAKLQQRTNSGTRRNRACRLDAAGSDYIPCSVDVERLPDSVGRMTRIMPVALSFEDVTTQPAEKIGRNVSGKLTVRLSARIRSRRNNTVVDAAPASSILRLRAATVKRDVRCHFRRTRLEWTPNKRRSASVQMEYIERNSTRFY